MEKEFIPYEQALALKELGFDEPCFGYHNIDPYLKIPAFNLVKPFEHEWCLPAPLKQQVFRWFREKHGYYISVFRTHDNNWGVDLWLLGVHKPKATIFGETYEEAENACLNKLIELTTNRLRN